MMSEQVQVTLDRELHDRLLELAVPPYNTINDVVDRLLTLDGHPSRAATELASEEIHYTMEEERQRAINGVYDGSGISS